MLVRKPVENEHTSVFKRIVHKLDLNSIYTDKSPAMQFNVSVLRTSASPNFKLPYYFLFENETFYFLTTVDRPATLRLNVYFNSTMKPTQEIRKFTRVFDIKEDKTSRTHVVELKTTSPLETILKSEKAIVENFESKLWKSAKPCKDCLAINYIIPNGNSEYIIGVASTEKHSDLLDEYCFLNSIPNDALKITNLTVNRKSVQCKSLSVAQKQPVQEYVVNVFANVSAKIMTRSFGQGFVNFMNWLPNMTPWRDSPPYNPRDYI